MSDDARDILQAAEVQRSYGVELLEISRMQKALIEGGQYSELIEMLQHKQRILDRLHDQTTPNYQCLQNWPHVREALTPQERNSIEVTLGETERLFQDLTQYENQCQQLLQTQRDQTSTQLKKLSQSNNVRSAYQAVVACEPRSRIDLVQ